MSDLNASEPRRAVVIGASIAGLLSARVLSDHFDEVEIVDRDRLPDGPEFRALAWSAWIVAILIVLAIGSLYPMRSRQATA
jgi:glycine/D-amino acid oxidase-like deaminating enzyme